MKKVGGQKKSADKKVGERDETGERDTKQGSVVLQKKSADETGERDPENS